jgi:hypothetical protein
MWREAVIEIQSVEKGKPAKKNQVVVLFPQSKDVMWYKAPKFQKDQEGAWLLHRNQTQHVEVHRWMGAQAAQQGDGYTALNPLDFQPQAQVKQIKQLIKQNP